MFSSAAACCVYVTNDQFTNALSFANSTTSNNLDDIDMYMTNTVAVRACLRVCQCVCERVSAARAYVYVLSCVRACVCVHVRAGAA